MSLFRLYIILALMNLIIGHGGVASSLNNAGGQKMALTLVSSAFEEGGFIPSQYTCDGKDISPPFHGKTCQKVQRVLP